MVQCFCNQTHGCKRKRQGRKGASKQVLHNGSKRRSNAVGNRNGACTTYTSPTLKALLQAMPANAPTAIGKGSVVGCGTVPAAYTINSCKGAYHTPTGNGNNELLQSAPFQPTYSPTMGVDLFWCTSCRQWVITERLYKPQPKAAPLTITQAARVGGSKASYTKTFNSRTSGNVFTGERV